MVVQPSRADRSGADRSGAAQSGVVVPGDVVAALRAGRLVMLGSPGQKGGRGRAVLFGVAGLMSAECVTLMSIHGRGLVSIAVDSTTALRLGLRRMPSSGRDLRDSAEYLVSIEASACSGTGISAADRAMTLRAAGAPAACCDDLIAPGHIVPLLVRDGSPWGVSPPEVAHAVVARHTGYAVAAWCDVLDEAGEVADLDDGVRLAQSLGLLVLLEAEYSGHADSAAAIQVAA